MISLLERADRNLAAQLAGLLKGAVLAAPLFFAGTVTAMPQTPQLPARFVETRFADLDGWQEDNHYAALKSFLRFCEKPEAVSGGPAIVRISPENLSEICPLARAALADDHGPRQFFEKHFTPYRIAHAGFVTGYFEPEVVASREKTADFSVPLHSKPSGLEAVNDDNRPASWPDHLSHGRRTSTGLLEMPDRGAIMAGALDDEKLELVWLQDPIEAYFIHVQGSARLRLTDGSNMRVGYAGKTGHPYTGIGRLLVKRGEGTPDDFTMDGLKRWLKNNPDDRDALFKENRSYIFFREVIEVTNDRGPIGATGLPLVPGRSLAIDSAHVPYGSLIFVSPDLPDPKTPETAFRRLMVADDTGSAIKGPARGDIFVGSGDTAGQIAGEIHHPAEFTILVPSSNLSDATAMAN